MGTGLGRVGRRRCVGRARASRRAIRGSACGWLRLVGSAESPTAGTATAAGRTPGFVHEQQSGPALLLLVQLDSEVRRTAAIASASLRLRRSSSAVRSRARVRPTSCLCTRCNGSGRVALLLFVRGERLAGGRRDECDWAIRQVAARRRRFTLTAAFDAGAWSERTPASSPAFLPARVSSSVSPGYDRLGAPMSLNLVCLLECRTIDPLEQRLSDRTDRAELDRIGTHLIAGAAHAVRGVDRLRRHLEGST